MANDNWPTISVDESVMNQAIDSNQPIDLGEFDKYFFNPDFSSFFHAALKFMETEIIQKDPVQSYMWMLFGDGIKKKITDYSKSFQITDIKIEVVRKDAKYMLASFIQNNKQLAVSILRLLFERRIVANMQKILRLNTFLNQPIDSIVHFYEQYKITGLAPSIAYQYSKSKDSNNIIEVYKSFKDKPRSILDVLTKLHKAIIPEKDLQIVIRNSEQHNETVYKDLEKNYVFFDRSLGNKILNSTELTMFLLRVFQYQVILTLINTLYFVYPCIPLLIRDAREKNDIEEIKIQVKRIDELQSDIQKYMRKSNRFSINA